MIRKITYAPLVLAVFCHTEVLAQQPAQKIAVKTAIDSTDKIKCKRFVETGSLAKVRKECHTEAEWRHSAEQNRQDARDLVNSALATTSTSN